jgi:hypothetical protein
MMNGLHYPDDVITKSINELHTFFVLHMYFLSDRFRPLKIVSKDGQSANMFSKYQYADLRTEGCRKCVT